LFYAIFGNVKPTNPYKEIFADHKLRNTPIRQEILTIFQNAKKAISHQDIEDSLAGTSDRVTIYRTLQKFIDHGLVHQIEDGNQTFYALCVNCEHHDHTDDHVHFKCVDCNTIVCVHTSNKVQFAIPSNYKIHQMKILLEGSCGKCQAVS